MKKTLFNITLLLLGLSSFAQSDSVLVPEVKVDIPEPSICLPPKDPLDIFEVVEISPEFPGGIQELYEFLGENLHFPEMSLDSQIQNKTYVSFVVLKTGKIHDIKVIKGVDSSIEKEIIATLRKMPDWIPGKMDGKCVNVRFTLPLHIHYE